jgi:hypothetical protein
MEASSRTHKLHRSYEVRSTRFTNAPKSPFPSCQTIQTDGPQHPFCPSRRNVSREQVPPLQHRQKVSTKDVTFVLSCVSHDPCRRGRSFVLLLSNGPDRPSGLAISCSDCSAARPSSCRKCSIKLRAHSLTINCCNGPNRIHKASAICIQRRCPKGCQACRICSCLSLALARDEARTKARRDDVAGC